MRGWWLFEQLDAAEREKLLAATHRRRFKRDEVVCHEQDTGDTLHLIDSGRLLVRVSTPHGDTTTLALLGPGDTFGELALLRGEHERSATVVAVEPSETLVLHRRDFDALRSRNPTVNDHLVVMLADKVDQLNHRLLEASYLSIECRLARTLLEVAPAYRGDGPDTVVTLTQEDLAGLVSATRPTVNRALKHLEELGAISLSRGRIELRDVGLLSTRAQRW